MAKEEKKVSVEMTEAQKEKVVDILAKDKEQKAAKKQVEIELRFEHARNNQHYGPGRIVVDADLGASLFAADYQAYMSRLREMESTNKNIEILSRGVAKITETRGDV